MHRVGGIRSIISGRGWAEDITTYTHIHVVHDQRKPTISSCLRHEQIHTHTVYSA